MAYLAMKKSLEFCKTVTQTRYICKFIGGDSGRGLDGGGHHLLHGRNLPPSRHQVCSRGWKVELFERPLLLAQLMLT